MGVDRNREFQDTVQEFMSETLNKPYRMLGNVLGTQEDDDHLSEKVNAKAGFFCSELIACCLKRLNLLDLTQPSSQYYPGHFSTENARTSIKLLSDAFYSEEIIVDVQ